MSVPAKTDTALGRAPLLALLGGTAATALLITVALILPAEYGRDPLGIGKATGIDRLWAPPEIRVAASAGDAAAARSYGQAYRSDIVEIPLAASGDPERGDEIEYKVRMKKGSTYIYSWDVPGIADPEEFYSEFHGHTVEDGKAMTVAEYRKSTGTSDHGSLVAPFSGVHGWYLQNQSLKPVTVRLRLAGFYEIIPAGEPGNEAGLEARQVR